HFYCCTRTRAQGLCPELTKPYKYLVRKVISFYLFVFVFRQRTFLCDLCRSSFFFIDPYIYKMADDLGTDEPPKFNLADLNRENCWIPDINGTPFTDLIPDETMAPNKWLIPAEPWAYVNVFEQSYDQIRCLICNKIAT
ncbi:unnamed protein product, partial [Amoebophrya sp. A120]